MQETASASRRMHHRHRLRLRRFRPGAAPGALEAAPAGAEDTATEAATRLLVYGSEAVLSEQEQPALSPQVVQSLGAQGTLWLHLQGQPAPEQLQGLGTAFDLHALALEDVNNREGRSKCESYDSYEFLVLGYLYRDQAGDLCSGQASFFLGPGFLVSVDDGREDRFERVRARLQQSERMRSLGADYLLYALLDLLIDSGFVLLEQTGEHLEELEDRILQEPDAGARDQLHYLKRDLVLMRRVWWPQREVVQALLHEERPLVSRTTRLYLRDCHEHCLIGSEFLQMYREMASNLLETYLSAVSQRMNDVIKALTIIATIFLPLTFISGLYGMNFDTSSRWNMPELGWRFGYLAVLGLMVSVVVGMLLYFRRKRWW